LEIHHAVPHILDLGVFTVPAELVIWMFTATFVAFLVVYMAGKGAMVPGRYQSAMEVIVTGIKQNLVIDTMGPQGLPYFPFIATLFFFVFFNNIIGILPIWDYGYVATSNPHVTGTLAVMVLAVVLHAGLKKKGVGGFIKSFIPSGVPSFLLPLIFPVEIISFFAKHFALAVRLYANMFAGHTVLIVFATGAAGLFIQGFYVVLSPFPFLGVVAMLLFEIFVATVQAFIFAILSALYIGSSLSEHH
jgi:F-type H+-transporting ATPase subunit a